MFWAHSVATDSAEEEEFRHFNTFDSARAPSLTLFSTHQLPKNWSMELVAQEKKMHYAVVCLVVQFC